LHATGTTLWHQSGMYDIIGELQGLFVTVRAGTAYREMKMLKV